MVAQGECGNVVSEKTLVADELARALRTWDTEGDPERVREALRRALEAVVAPAIPGDED